MRSSRDLSALGYRRIVLALLTLLLVPTVLMLAVVRTEGGDEEIRPYERVLSAGCAIQNMLLMATAMGYGSALTSGKALQARALRELFGLTPAEQALCFVSIGTVASTGTRRARPAVDRFFSELAP